MNDYTEISKWILSDIPNNAPIYTSLLKEIVPNYLNSNPNFCRIKIKIVPEDIKWRIDKVEDEGEPHLHIFITDSCYQITNDNNQVTIYPNPTSDQFFIDGQDYKHSMETLMSIVEGKYTYSNGYSKLQHYLIPNKYYFYNNHEEIIGIFQETIFNYNYVQAYIRNHKINLFIDKKEFAGISESSNYSNL